MTPRAERACKASIRVGITFGVTRNESVDRVGKRSLRSNDASIHASPRTKAIGEPYRSIAGQDSGNVNTRNGGALENISSTGLTPVGPLTRDSKVTSRSSHR